MMNVGRRSLAAMAISVLVITALPVAAGAAGRPSTTPTPFSITTNPPLEPAFSASIHDYVVPCTDQTTTSIATTGSGSVTLGTSTHTGPVSATLHWKANQELTIASGGQSYFVRCLPTDFPSYTSTITGPVQSKNGYLVTLNDYVVIFDPQGVPVWWFRDGNTPKDAKFLSPTTIAWSDGLGTNYSIVERTLTGTLLKTVTNPSSSMAIDGHDFEVLPNGNLLTVVDGKTSCAKAPSSWSCPNLSSSAWGDLSTHASILDDVIVELNPQGKVVWQWSTAHHVNVAVQNTSWQSFYPDVFHLNSIEYDGHGGILVSYRHLDAIYRVDMATGAITWKLGGTPTPQSLTVVGDDDTPLFSGQHDARIAPNGDLTLYDDGTRAVASGSGTYSGRPPRALAFTINTTTKTATEDADITDPNATYSPYMGSAQELLGGDWVVDWVGQAEDNFVGEYTSTGSAVATISFSGVTSYREAPVTATISTLRSAMNAMTAPITSVP